MVSTREMREWIARSKLSHSFQTVGKLALFSHIKPITHEYVSPVNRESVPPAGR